MGSRIIEQDWLALGDKKGGSSAHARKGRGKGTSAGKGKGKAAKLAERRARTIYVGNYPEDTKDKDIKAHIREIPGRAKGVEDIYAFDKFCTLRATPPAHPAAAAR